MTLEQFYTYQERTFDAYTAIVIKNESRNTKKEIARRAKYEISLSQLMNDELFPSSLIELLMTLPPTDCQIGKLWKYSH